MLVLALGLVQWRGLMVWSRSWFWWSSPQGRVEKGPGFGGVHREARKACRLQDFLDALQSFEAYLRFQAAGFCGYVAKLEAYTPKIPGQGYFIFPEIPGVRVNSP